MYHLQEHPAKSFAETPISKKAFGCTNSIFHLCKMLCYLHMNINCIMKYYSSLTYVQSFATFGYKHFWKCITTRRDGSKVETSSKIKQENVFVKRRI